MIKAMIRMLMFYFKYNVYNLFDFRALKFFLKVKNICSGFRWGSE